MKNKLNPFPFSDDNKRYHTWNYYLKHRYGMKIAKIPLDAGFTCPNRDGTKGIGGCTFCTSAGSGDTIISNETLAKQFDDGLAVMRRKWPDCGAIAYFQAYTNTYGTLQRLRECFEPFFDRPDVTAVSIATRADCLEEDKIRYFAEIAEKKDLWIELGLQSIHDRTAAHIHRAHDYQQFYECVQRLAQTKIKICVHLINSLPYESKEMMIESAKAVGKLPVHALKIHMLHLMKHTQMANEYEKTPFHLQTMDEYVDTVIRQLEVLPPHIILQRLTGDGLASDLIAPQWTVKKVQVLNEIDKAMASRNTWQGKFFIE